MTRIQDVDMISVPIRLESEGKENLKRDGKESYDHEDPERFWPSWMTVESLGRAFCREMLRRESPWCPSWKGKKMRAGEMIRNRQMLVSIACVLSLIGRGRVVFFLARASGEACGSRNVRKWFDKNNCGFPMGKMSMGTEDLVACFLEHANA